MGKVLNGDDHLAFSTPGSYFVLRLPEAIDSEMQKIKYCNALNGNRTPKQIAPSTQGALPFVMPPRQHHTVHYASQVRGESKDSMQLVMITKLEKHYRKIKEEKKHCLLVWLYDRS